LVSHDEQEIRTLGTEIIHLRNGQIISTATPDAFFTNDFPAGSITLSGRITVITRTGRGYRITVNFAGQEVVMETAEIGNRKVGDLINFENKDSL
ncbi:MAG: hypothetical protein INR69_21435, partial [Mucilaginibacter polytrichastri]|nr:hypothetical protein [Mucilaginibacter polytrichastri]